jgi:hypothetical protein
MTKIRHLALAGLFAAVAFVTMPTMIALAQQIVATNPDAVATGQIVVPVGAWAEAAREIVVAVAVGALAWLMRALPENIVNLLRTLRVEQLLGRAIDYAYNMVQGAAKDKGTVTFTTGNELANQAVQYVIDNGPKFLIDWMGGVDGIRQKVLARIPNVAPEVALTDPKNPV